MAGPGRRADAARLVDGILTTGLCVGLAALLPVARVGPALAALLGAAGALWLAVAISGDAMAFGARREDAWDATAWDVTAWDMALVSLAASVGVRMIAPLGP
ncbi:hypothetical protein ASF49_20795 [Methylobacterium sp. Leaf104]|uniref:hypothetical protein n=1 Tax=Methylobacterium TaxID=407 RepID=UPI0006F3D184|nr:hypothetical protein [Methylobacterium sp. Leaf104]KQP40646.1 hypothetical protein ASF49_20795 [Methylobacterium sp. Leaf104]MCI9882777.1 hypothetical protein [Methylobacterium goesingense]